MILNYHFQYISSFLCANLISCLFLHHTSFSCHLLLMGKNHEKKTPNKQLGRKVSLPIREEEFSSTLPIPLLTAANEPWTFLLLGHSITAPSLLSDAHSSGTHTINASQSSALPAWQGLANWHLDEYVRLVLPLSAKAREEKQPPAGGRNCAGSDDCTDDKPFQARGQISGMWVAGPCGWRGWKL